MAPKIMTCDMFVVQHPQVASYVSNPEYTALTPMLCLVGATGGGDDAVVKPYLEFTPRNLKVRPQTISGPFVLCLLCCGCFFGVFFSLCVFFWFVWGLILCGFLICVFVLFVLCFVHCVFSFCVFVDLVWCLCVFVLWAPPCRYISR